MIYIYTYLIINVINLKNSGFLAKKKLFICIKVHSILIVLMAHLIV